MLLRRLRQYGLCRRKQPSEEVLLRKLENALKRLLMDLGQWEGIGQSGIHWN